MSRYWSAFVHDLHPYIPGEQPKGTDLVKLNTNENPYGPSPRVLEAIRLATSDRLRLYPDATSDSLTLTIAAYYKVDKNNVFVGNGSDEVLAHIFNAFFKHDTALLFPDITYSFYPVYCGMYQIDYETVPLNDAFEIKVEDYFKPNAGIIFPNPNAPTGRLLALSDIEVLLQKNTESVVVIDEAYIDFGGDSAVALTQQYLNLLVVQTLSKSRSLAGIRVGYAIGHEDLIEALVRVKDSFNSYPLDLLAQVAAEAAIQDQRYFAEITQKVIASREKLVIDMQDLGFEVIPSSANFIFCRHPKTDASVIAKHLRDEGVIVRHFNKNRIAQFLRISIGTPTENQRLMTALDSLL